MTIQKYLMSKGIKPSLSGFSYLVMCVKICRSESLLKKPAKNLYELVAEKNGVTLSTVSKCISYALEQADIADTPMDFIVKALIDLSEED